MLPALVRRSNIHARCFCKRPMILWAVSEGAFPVAEQAADRVLSLPNYPEMSDEMVGLVAEKVKVLINAN